MALSVLYRKRGRSSVGTLVFKEVGKWELDVNGEAVGTNGVSLDQKAGPELWSCPPGPSSNNVINLRPPGRRREGTITKITLPPEICVLRSKELHGRRAERRGCPNKYISL